MLVSIRLARNLRAAYFGGCGLLEVRAFVLGVVQRAVGGLDLVLHVADFNGLVLNLARFLILDLLIVVKKVLARRYRVYEYQGMLG